ncbi:MAG: hypothetical protein AAGN64_08205 [Bacteroidota bacterium]
MPRSVAFIALLLFVVAAFALGVHLTPIAALLVILPVIAGLCGDAVQDTLDHQWHRSVFRNWSGEDPYHWWGRANLVWLRRYKGHDPDYGPSRAYRRWSSIPVIGSALFHTFNDAWHVSKLVQLLAWASWGVVLASVVQATMTITAWPNAEPVLVTLPNWKLLVALVAAFVLDRLSFEIGYQHIWTTR